jgi:hypothetical protein
VEFTEKAIADSVALANANREDLSDTMFLTDGPARPMSQTMAHVGCTNPAAHQWTEIGLNVAGRANVAAGGATYAENGLPNAAAKSPNRKSNRTCNIGRLAAVSDNEMAAFNGGNGHTQLKLADGEMVRGIEDALDFEVALTSVEVLNQIEWMHITGDSTNATMEGGETDGLWKWALAGGANANPNGNAGNILPMAEQFIKDGGYAVGRAGTRSGHQLVRRRWRRSSNRHQRFRR